MTIRTAIMTGISVLVLTGATAGIVTQSGIATASSKGEAKAFKQARDLAAKASKALAKGKAEVAIKFAEASVSLNPQFADYRVLLGQSYLKAGRFMSARQSFADALTLAPGNGRVALNLSLAQIAVGEWDAARQTLDANAANIPVSDRGLAMALAGDPAGAVELLSAAARSPDADAKTRQNLALAFALAGRWQEAKTTVSIDLAAGDVDARIVEWAAFARPKSASDQVATMLGVTPVADAGQPVALALNAQPATSAMAAVQADPIDAYMPGPAETSVASGDVQMPDMVAPTPVRVAAVRFGPRQEVVQGRVSQMATATVSPLAQFARVVSKMANFTALDAPTPAAAKPRVAVMAASVTPRAVSPVAAIATKGSYAVATKASYTVASKGSYYVQLGAYENVNVAKDAWSRVTRRHAAFGNHTPQGMGVTTKAGSFYRLSVGGFARADAVSLCSRYKAQGGNCFVRTGAGDQVARWARGPALASR